MSDTKKPEAIADEDLDGAQGGGTKHEFRERVSFTYGSPMAVNTGDGRDQTLKTPGMNTEHVSEDE